jgi:hypothetical protein
LVCLAYVALGQGDRERTEALMNESLDLWCEMGNRAGVAVSLAGFAALAAAEVPSPIVRHHQERLRRTARLLGAADALSEATGFRLHPLERVEFDRNVAFARAELGDEAFSDAWAEGRAMTLEQAAAYAKSAVIE